MCAGGIHSNLEIFRNKKTTILPDLSANYVLVEQYPGFLEVVYDQKDRKKVRQINLEGPIPISRFQARLEKISASYRIERKSGFQVVKKTKPADFSVGGTGSIDFGYIDYSDYSKSAVKLSGTYDPFKIYRAGVSLIDG